ncbi:MAG: cytochrome C oxidase subunit IV family protein [Phycisphaerales bacterium]
MSVHEPHVVPLKWYLGVFVALLVLLVATVAVAFVPLGGLNTPLALIIAITKAALVGAIFMHLRYNPWIVILFALSGVYWLAILIGLMMSDYLTR